MGLFREAPDSDGFSDSPGALFQAKTVYAVPHLTPGIAPCFQIPSQKAWTFRRAPYPKTALFTIGIQTAEIPGRVSVFGRVPLSLRV